MTRAKHLALVFISSHPGTRAKAFPWGYRYHFEAPELKRAPFRSATIESLIAEGLVSTENDVVQISIKGKDLLRTYQERFA